MSFESTPTLFVPEIAGLSILLAVSILTFASLIIFLYRSRHPRFSPETERDIQKARSVADEIITSAHRESVKTLEDAQKKSLGLISSSSLFRTEAEKKLESVLQKHSEKESERLARSSEEFLRVYNLALEDAKKIYLASVKKMNELMEEETRQGLQEFRSVLKRETERYGRVTEEEIKKIRDEESKRIEEYTKEKLKRVDNSIYEVIADVSKEVLGKVLSAEGHEELVIRALEEAKKEHFFSR